MRRAGLRRAFVASLAVALLGASTASAGVVSGRYVGYPSERPHTTNYRITFVLNPAHTEISHFWFGELHLLETAALHRNDHGQLHFKASVPGSSFEWKIDGTWFGRTEVRGHVIKVPHEGHGPTHIYDFKATRPAPPDPHRSGAA